MRTVVIDGSTFDCTLAEREWAHGICVEITATNESTSMSLAKVCCSSSASANHALVSQYTPSVLHDEAWQVFLRRCPPAKVQEVADSGLTILLPWSAD